IYHAKRDNNIKKVKGFLMLTSIYLDNKRTIQDMKLFGCFHSEMRVKKDNKQTIWYMELFGCFCSELRVKGG
ncbi:12992_t:CDS:2, partial [Ambispora gerdemannii]